MARNHIERELQAVRKKMADLVGEYQEIYDKAGKEERRLTDQENEDVAKRVKDVTNLKNDQAELERQLETYKDVEAIGKSLGPPVSTLDARVTEDREDRMIQQVEKSLGQSFTESGGYKSLQSELKNSGRLPQGTSSGIIPLEMKGTLLEGAGSPGSGSGGGLLPVPQVVPGVVEKLFQQLRFADLLLSGQASGNTIRYVVEGTATSGAAGVGEGGAKPESTLGLSTLDEPIKKIATLLPISEEMLEDAPAVQSYINGRLSLFVQIEEERQLFRGASGGNEVQGILTSRNVPIYAGGTAAGGTLSASATVQLFKAMNGLRGSAFVEPEWIVMHPTDWESMRLARDTAAQFYGGGPFQGPYGSGANMAASGQVTGAQDNIWGKPVYVTAAIGGAGTALVGTRAGAQVWRRGGVSVEATNSHASYFANNLVAIRAEERVGLTVYRPGAYVEVRLTHVA